MTTVTTTESQFATDSTTGVIKWTLSTWQRADELGLFPPLARYELLNGELYTVPPASPAHDWIVQQLCKFLAAQLADQPLQVREEKTIYISETSTPKPDISIVKDLDYFGNHPEPSDVYLVIEISNSHLKRDRELKRDIYAAAAIAEYWVFDLQQRSFTRYASLVDGVYTETLLQDGHLTIAGVEIAVAELLKLAFR